jgi:outer membrane protein OmpA-like peptidoglycan-associated protein
MPHSGNGYCGIYCSKNEYREYLQTELREPLKAGTRYRVSFHVCLSENSTVAVSTIGALFTPDRIADTAKSILMRKSSRSIGSLVNQVISTPYSPQVVSNHILADTAEWMEIGGEFIAEGGELFLTIGNFFDVAHSGIAEYDWLSQMLTGSYYYIDDVSVIQVSEDTPSIPDTQELKSSAIPATQQTLSVGSTLVLHDIYFQFDRSVILQQSYKELTRLLELMQDNPKLRIEIGGHTDDKGSVEYNRKLSESRAKAVADYLTSKGIDPKRLSYRGYGKSKPIEDNSTEEGRSKNRRVEIKVLSK